MPASTRRRSSAGARRPLGRRALFLPRSPPHELRLHAGRHRHHLFDLHVLIRRLKRVAGSVKFLSRLEHRLRAERSPGIVASEQGLEFTDDLFGGFRNQVAFDLEFE